MSRLARPEFEQALERLRLEQLERWAEPLGASALPLREWLALAEAWRIARALREARGNRSAAARALGIGRRTLYTKIEKLGLGANGVRLRARSG
jgi:DNA-binding NtrC family response regulator